MKLLQLLVKNSKKYIYLIIEDTRFLVQQIRYKHYLNDMLGQIVA